MNKINIMIKPASSKCNLKCKYCFYNKISQKREVEDFGYLSEKTYKNIIDKAFSIKGIKNINFSFQGGEPLLWGSENFSNFIDYVNEKKNKEIVNYAIQTNGLLIDYNYIDIFKKNNILIGISLDGAKEVHDFERIDLANKGTHSKVIKKIELLKSNKVAFNILSVVTAKNVNNIEKTYEYIKSLGVYHMQFIPYINLSEKRDERNLSKKQFHFYLNRTYKLWKKDFNKKRVYLRYFDNLLRVLYNQNQELCQNRIGCSLQYVIEANGEVFPCDFYTTQKDSLGNINEMDFKSLFYTPKAQSFIKDSYKISNKCRTCKFLSFCGGGCKVQSKKTKDTYENIYCEEYYKFLTDFTNDIKGFYEN